MIATENETPTLLERIRSGELRLPRRSVMKTGALAAAGATAGLMPGMRSARAATITVADADVLNFALNLEYLEANYYLLGVTGSPLPASLTNGGLTPTYPTTTLVPFQTAQLADYFQRIASDEQTHVQFLLEGLGGSAIPQPQIDLSASFTTLALAAGLIVPGQTFNPFASEIDFIIGAYIFEDVGVTAYGGGANFLQLGVDNPNIAYAASILAIEGYHAGAIRGYLASRGGGLVTNKISALRATLSNAADDNGTDLSGSGGNPFNIVNGDSNAQSFRRTFNQVLNIVYGGAAATEGLFFPTGVNGNIKSSTDTFVNQNG